MKSLITLLAIIALATQLIYAATKTEGSKTASSQTKDRWADHVEKLLTSEIKPEVQPGESKRRHSCQVDLKDSQKLEVKTTLQAHRTNIANLRVEARQARKMYREVLKNPDSTFEDAELAAARWLRSSSALLTARNQARNHILYNVVTPEQRVTLNKCMFYRKKHHHGKKHGERYMRILKEKCEKLAAKEPRKSPAPVEGPENKEETEGADDSDYDEDTALEDEITAEEKRTAKSKTVTESEKPVKTMLEYEK